jgi:8-oxo-dGTP diphosphatase
VGKSDQGVRASAGRYNVIPRVLVFVFNGDDVLLLKGAPTKRIWANLYNGVGGHVEPREDVYTAALRETQEETGLDVHDLRLRGIANIDIGPQADAVSYTGIMLFVFSGRSREREGRPSKEGTLEWVPLSRLGEYDLVEDLPVVLRRIRAMSAGDPPFFARYAYDEDDRLQITFARSA